MDINNELVLEYDINFYGIKIHPFTIDEIFRYGFNEYNKLLIPYCLTFDVLQIPLEEHDNYNMFDIILSSNELLSLLYNSLKEFCKTNNINILHDSIFIDKGKLDRNNFDEFCDIILKINARMKPKEDRLPENPKQRELELKFRALRAKHKVKSEYQLSDIINIVKYGGKYYIPTEEIRKMTLWGLYNAFSSKIGVSNYDDNFSIALVCGDKNNTINDSHWTKVLKVDK